MNYLKAFHSIKGFIFDVDGVFTNNELLVLESGQMLRRMHARDGLAVKIALEAGYFVGIITGGSSEGVTRRFRNLGVETIYSGISDKAAAFKEMVTEHGLKAEELVYMGDDLVDLPVLNQVGLPVAPTDAAPEVLEIAKFITTLGGGAGCVRELIEKCLRIVGKWPA